MKQLFKKPRDVLIIKNVEQWKQKYHLRKKAEEDQPPI